jgi:hypothetical protein
MAALRPTDYLAAARCPPTLEPQEFGLWKIARRDCRAVHKDAGYAAAVFKALNGADVQTVLLRMTEATMHLDGEVVMEDSLLELRRHLPIWLAARGRVLVTGLGLGCVVRGLLASPDVGDVDVIEIDQGIIDAVGPEFANEPRVHVYRGDALTCGMPGKKWDFAWHDIWCEESGLQLLHTKLLARFEPHVERQGAWMLPRIVKRTLNAVGWDLVG